VKFRSYISWITLLVGMPTAQAQQEEKYLDAHPQDVYNATTTLFTTQENIQYNQKGYQPIADDMSIIGMHRFTFVQQHGNKLQNLGNNGTAAKPIFYVIPGNIGVTSGFHAYDIYFRSPDQLRYYDTKSPYSKLYVILARFGSFYADVCHSRNLTPNWNIGANFRNMMTDKEWVPNSRGDKNVIAYGLDLFTHYKTDNEQYQLLAHFLIAKHRVRETGGIYTKRYVSNPNPTAEHMLWKMDMANRLRIKDLQKSPESSDARRRFHLYHQLALTEQLWAYHELRIWKNKHQFKTDALHENNKMFLESNKIDTTTTFWNSQNEWGTKGDWKDWFYCGYYRHKKIECRPQQKENNKDLHEHYMGLSARYQLADETGFLHLGGEYLLQEGCYKAHAAYEGAIFDLACEHSRYKPSFLEQYCYDYHHNGDEQLTPPAATRISGGFLLVGSSVQLKPHLSLTRITDHIYFEHKFKGSKDLKSSQKVTTIAVPKQTKKHADIVTLGTDLDLAFGAYMHWDSEFTAAKALGPSAELFNIPTFLINSRLYYTNTTDAGNGTFETGIDVHWKSSYKADAYDPVTQQFYLQDVFTVHSYPIIDLFLNFRIKNFGAFLKFSHCNESWLAPAPGYFVTPYYPGQKKAFDIGINWSFFD
jgi:hypothetical protein